MTRLCIKLTILFLLSRVTLAAHEIRSESAFDVGRICGYQFISDDSISPAAVLSHYNTTWLKSERDVVALGDVSQPLWFKCQFANETTVDSWFLVSRYPFSSRISVYQTTDNKLWMQSVTGSQLTESQKSMPLRNDAVKINFPRGKESLFLIKYESDFTKILFFQLMPERHLLRSENQEMIAFAVFATITVLVIAFNFLLAWRLKTTLPFFYCAALAAAYLYQNFEFGFGSWIFFPQSAGKSPYLLMAFGAATMALYPLFLSKLLSLRSVIPYAHKLILVIIAVAGIFFVVNWLQLLPVVRLQQTGRAIYFIVTVIVFFVVARVYFMGYRPALYSGYGLLVLFASQNVYLLTMSGVLQIDGYWIKYCVPAGQLAEFAFFLRSLFLRLSDKDDLLKLESIEAEQEHLAVEKTSPKRLRLEQAKADQIALHLEQLFREKKIFTDDSLSLERLSAQLGVKRHELSELLNVRFGSNFYDYVNRYRVSEAQRLMTEDRTRRILDVTMEVGFNNKSTFNKEFKRLTGKTPKEFRTKAKA